MHRKRGRGTGLPSENPAHFGRHQAPSARGGRGNMPGMPGPSRSRQRYRDDRSRSSPFHGTRMHTTTLDEIRKLLQQETEIITLKLLSPQFKLRDILRESTGEITEMLLDLINKVCNTVSSPQNVSHILQQVNTSGFFTGPVIAYITKCRMTLLSPDSCAVLLTICGVLKACQDRIPAGSSENVTSVLAQLKAVETSKHFTLPTQYKKCLQEIEEKHTTILRQIQGRVLMKVRNMDRDNDDNYLEPPNNFREVPIGPVPEDLRGDIEPYLRKNRITGGYRDTEQYLDIQFRLLREDFMYPLRQGIKELRRAREIYTDEKYIQDVNVYTDVRYLGLSCSGKGILYHIQFNALKLRRIKWEFSKRLIYGSLVCLSSDDFTTFMIGTVEERDNKLLKEGMVDILVNDAHHHVDLDPFTVYKMVECSAYFEAYRYNLESLQELNDAKLPFLDYLLGQRKRPPSPPRYLRGNDVQYDFEPLLKRSSSCKRWAILDKSKWMKASDFGLDASQYDALEMALTHEFSLVQGPPGTGKTFIALKIVQILLHNFRVWGRRLREEDIVKISNAPILLVCYTNHALDQFLEGILKFTDDDSGSVVRIGGRCNSENEKLLRCQLSKLKRDRSRNTKIPEEIKVAKREIIGQMDNCEKNLTYIENERIYSLTHVLDDRCLIFLMTEIHRMYFELQETQRSAISLVGEWLLRDDSRINETKIEPCDEGTDTDSNTPLPNQTNDNLDTQIARIIDEEISIIEQDRRIDTEDSNTDYKRLGHVSKRALHQLLNLQGEPTPKDDPGEWKKTMSNKRSKKSIRSELNKQECMSEEEESTILDIGQLLPCERWSLYRLWRRRFGADCSYRIKEQLVLYNQLAERLGELRQMEDYHMLTNTKVIAMTTTGAAKYRNILHRIKPSIVIVEEAAEVLEAHIITSLSESCEHLILIGDHQQLRPKPAVYKLAQRYHLDVSLFERMLVNNLPCTRLETQHRMRPAIAKLIVPHIYPHLFNATSVEEYDNVRGIGGNLFFIHHKHAEMNTADTKSRKNIHEAEYLTALCRYLILQGYQNSEVTILTTYTGQMFEIKKRIISDEVTSGVRVTPVDNFQGEENDIILLSLVRSNEQGNAGFVKIANRICVALSRAKKGLFVIGDMQLMEEASSIWKEICTDLKTESKIVDGIPLFCQNHPETRICVVDVKDFKKAPNGGCTRPCEYRLKCGHVCEMSCHHVDPEHKQYKCQKPCPKKPCKLKHQCPKKCFQDCGKCNVLVEKTISRCQHKLLIPCHVDPALYKCTIPCEKTMECGHRCPSLCGYSCLHYTECQVIVLNREWPCGHQLDVECYKNKDNYPCPVKVERSLVCGHTVTIACSGSISNIKCQEIIPKRVWPCGHQLDVECYKNKDNYPCPVQVERTLACGHTVTVKCSGDTNKIKCMEKIDVVLCERKCKNTVICYQKDNIVKKRCHVSVKKVCEKNSEHVYYVKCSEYKNSVCNLPCETKLSCGHICPGHCGTCKLNKHESCKAKCYRMLPCHHRCQGICGDPCPPCRRLSMQSCPHTLGQKLCSDPCRCIERCDRRCQHSQCTQTCSEICNADPCGEPCPLRLRCRHACPCYCGEPCATICPECNGNYFESMHKKLGIPRNRETRYVVLLPCRHVIEVRYMDKIGREYSDHLRHWPREFKPFQCPMCWERITYCPKYQRLVVTCQREFEKVNEAILNNDTTWKSLSNSDIGKQLHKEILQQSQVGQANLCHTLRTCLGCFRLLNAVKGYARKSQSARRICGVQDLETSIAANNTELRHCVRDHSSRGKEIDLLSLKIQLLFMETILTDRIKYIGSSYNGRELRHLLREVNQTSYADGKTKVKRVIREINEKVRQITKDNKDYENQIKEYVKGYVDLLVEKKWILCRDGHAFSVPPATDVQTLHDSSCPLCANEDDNEMSSDDLNGTSSEEDFS